MKRKEKGVIKQLPAQSDQAFLEVAVSVNAVFSIEQVKKNLPSKKLGKLYVFRCYVNWWVLYGFKSLNRHPKVRNNGWDRILK